MALVVSKEGPNKGRIFIKCKDCKLFRWWESPPGPPGVKLHRPHLARVPARGRETASRTGLRRVRRRTFFVLTDSHLCEGARALPAACSPPRAAVTMVRQWWDRGHRRSRPL